MSQDLYTAHVSIPLVSCGTVAAGTTTIAVLQIPGTALGGGVYVRRWSFCSNTDIAAGSAPAVRLVTLGASGGTIGTIGANGSAGLSAGTTISGTLSTPWVAGTVGYLGIQYGHEAYGAATTVWLHANIQYFTGRGSA